MCTLHENVENIQISLKAYLAIFIPIDINYYLTEFLYNNHLCSLNFLCTQAIYINIPI